MNAANEQGACFMAAGYARASGKVGVALVTSGPGATNTVTPIRDCMADSIPIVVICGQVPTGAIGSDAFQEAPVPSIMGSAAKHVFLVTDPSRLEATMRTAFEIARTGRPGPVVVDVPKDVQNWASISSMGTMGFGLPAAIGAQFAQPERLVIDIDGDASIRMNLGELETVTTYDLPIKVVVLNNFGDGMVKQWQKLFFKGRLSASDKSLRKKDFIKAAQADGFPYAVRLERKADVRRIIEEFIAFKGPAFLEVLIDPDAGVYPMVGPGQCYEEMITGDWIPSRGTVEIKPPDSSEMF